MSSFYINKVVIHALVKEQHKSIKPSKYRETLLDPQDDTVQKTVDEVVKVYGTKNNNAHYGIFKIGEGRGEFPDKMEEYIEKENASDDDFMNITKTAMEKLYEKASSTPLASGGYLLFVDYAVSQNRFFLVAMVKQKPGITLTEKMEPEELMQLDLARLHQAARINFDKLKEYLTSGDDEQQAQSYLSFISPSSAQAAASYFVTALGCSPGAASAQATKTVIVESRNFYNSDKRLKPKQRDFHDDLLKVLEKKKEEDESLKLNELEVVFRRHIPEELAEDADSLSEKYLARLNSEECAVPAEFPVHGSTLKKYTKITGKATRWQVSFERTALGDDPAAEIYYDKQSEKIVIRNIPENMKSAINEELKLREQASKE